MPSLKDLQDLVNTRVNELGFNKDPKIILLLLMEELGEVTRAYLKENGYKDGNNRIVESAGEELGDTFYLLVCLANALNVDLEPVLLHTLEKLDKPRV